VKVRKADGGDEVERAQKGKKGGRDGDETRARKSERIHVSIV
jgi:hypothetical protein